jgi:hypothetical protein
VEIAHFPCTPKKMVAVHPLNSPIIASAWTIDQTGRSAAILAGKRGLGGLLPCQKQAATKGPPAVGDKELLRTQAWNAG